MKFVLQSQRALTSNVYHMQLTGDTTAVTKPGQFVQIQLPGFYLRRPISICDWQTGENGTLDLIYKVVGHGTEAMRHMPEGTELDLLVGLGNGFDVKADCQKPLLIGGGVGVPPMYGLCKALIAAGKQPSVVLGFNTESEVFWKDEFEALGCRVYISTVDGSLGTRGFVTDVMQQLEDQVARVNAALGVRLSAEAFAGEDDDVDLQTDIADVMPPEEEPLTAYTYFYACGPKPMLRAICNVATTSGQLSMEERMGCGFGACMGCTLVTAKGPKRVCADGPVFVKEDLVW